MKIIQAPLTGLLLIQPQKFTDSRGYFYESFQQEKYKQAGFPQFVQDNFSVSKKNVLRGLHYQLPQSQGKLVYVTRGKVWDVAVDLRKHSSTFGKWFGIFLDDEQALQFFIPAGFAHGFCVLSKEAHFHYKCTDYYHVSSEQGIAWNDAQLNISWPVKRPILSAKDSARPFLNEIPHEQLFY